VVSDSIFTLCCSKLSLAPFPSALRLRSFRLRLLSSLVPEDSQSALSDFLIRPDAKFLHRFRRSVYAVNPELLQRPAPSSLIFVEHKQLVLHKRSIGRSPPEESDYRKFCYGPPLFSGARYWPHQFPFFFAHFRGVVDVVANHPLAKYLFMLP